VRSASGDEWQYPPRRCGGSSPHHGRRWWNPSLEDHSNDHTMGGCALCVLQRKLSLLQRKMSLQSARRVPETVVGFDLSHLLESQRGQRQVGRLSPSGLACPSSSSRSWYRRSSSVSSLTRVPNGRKRSSVPADRAFTSSRSTLQRIQAGDPGVGIGIYAATLQALGLLDGLTSQERKSAPSTSTYRCTQPRFLSSTDARRFYHRRTAKEIHSRH
jgi:hypothetical protein